MAKRYYDSEIWKKKWFQKITDVQRSLFLYMLANCDCAGIYEPDSIMLSFFIKTDDVQKEISEINTIKKQVEILPNGRFFIIDFIEFQYFNTKDKHLNINNNAHKGVIKCLIKNDIDIKKYLAPNEPLMSPCLGALDMDKDMDKDKKECSNTTLNEVNNFVKIHPESEVIKKIENYHKEKFKKAKYLLSAKQKQEICKITNDNQLEFEHWKQIIKNASGGWRIHQGGNQYKRQKPCFDKILEKWERFYNNEYNLEKAEPDEEEQPKNIVKAVYEPTEEEKAEIERTQQRIRENHKKAILGRT